MLRVKFHEEVLRRMYWDEEKSLGEIAKVLKTNSGSVHGAMCRYRISRRSRGASLRLSYQVGRRVSKRTAIEKEALQEMYWKEGKSITEIAKTLRKSTATVYEATRYHQIPHRDKSSGLKLAYKRGKLVDKRYYMIRPNLTFNENLSYVLGVLKGDGWVSRYDKKRSIRYSVSLMADRREFVESFHDALAACGLHPRLGYRTSKRKWETTAYSKIFYEWYKKISLEDIEKEALKNRELAAAFIRGFYESEGTRNIQYYERKNWYRFQLAMSNTNRVTHIGSKIIS